MLDARFIRESHYREWLSNEVLVNKANGKWQTCVDFTDLNKACPKDTFPFPWINLIVELMKGYQKSSFMDANAGYNQLRMYEGDQ